jgi:hypothetical protein
VAQRSRGFSSKNSYYFAPFFRLENRRCCVLFLVKKIYKLPLKTAPFSGRLNTKYIRGFPENVAKIVAGRCRLAAVLRVLN